jgi:hypothetical protein
LVRKRQSVVAIDAYAYTIGILQPVLAFILFALSYIFSINSPWDVLQRTLGLSGASEEVAHWVHRGLPEYGVLSFHLISGAIIGGYLCISFSVAQKIRLWQAIGAVLSSFVFFLLLYMILSILVLVGILPERLMLWGGA